MFIDSCCKQILCFSNALTLCATRHHLQVLPKVILSAAHHKCLWWGSLKKRQRKERSFSYRSFCPIFTLEFSTFTSVLFINDLIMMQICILYHLTHLPPSSSRLSCHTVNPWPQITVQTSTSLINFEPIGNLHFSVLEWNHDSEGFKCHSHTKKTPVRKYSVVPSDYKDMSCEIIGWWI